MQAGLEVCPLHDTDRHDISECKVMLSQAKKLHSAWLNHTYDSKKNTPKKEELHSLIADAVQRALKTSESGKKRNRTMDIEELDVFNVQEDFSHITVSTESGDKQECWREGESLFAIHDNKRVGQQLDTTLTKKLYSLEIRYNRRSAKRLKMPLLWLLIFGRLNMSLGTPKLKTVKILCDSGASATIVSKQLVKN